ncbi:MAG: hypothetical protein JJT89_10465 [Nitriliruptoraceae bacterium]|nr:hypothetical protein [Nitriliruptoraceae bacterium]
MPSSETEPSETEPVVLRAPGVTRAVAVVGGLVVVGIAVLILVVGPGATGESPLVRLVFGSLLLLGGVTSVVRARVSLTLDASGLVARGALRSRRVAWDEVSRIVVEERTDAQARSVGNSVSRVGPVTVRSGAGTRRRDRRGVGLSSPGTGRTVLVAAEGPSPALQIGIAGQLAEDATATLQAAVDRWAPPPPPTVVGPGSPGDGADEESGSA